MLPRMVSFASPFSSITPRLRSGKPAAQPTVNCHQTICGVMTWKNHRAVCRPLQPLVRRHRQLYCGSLR